jgi:hypothetical protein
MSPQGNGRGKPQPCPQGTWLRALTHQYACLSGSNMSSAAVAIEQRVLEGGLDPSSTSRTSLLVRLHVARLLVLVGARLRSAHLGLLVGSSRRAGRHSFARFTVCARQHSVVAARAGSGLRCVRPFGVSRSLAITSSVPAHRSDLHPSNRKVALVVAR